MKHSFLFILTIACMLSACAQRTNPTTKEKVVAPNQQQLPQVNQPQQQQQQNVNAPFYPNASTPTRGAEKGSYDGEILLPPSPDGIPNEVPKNRSADKSTVQVAVLLDTSNSMDGLIDQAKSQLWKMVNELSMAKDEAGKVPNLEIGLYDYGNDNIAEQYGHVRLIMPFTDDLDLISEKLFALSTKGGEEYCGLVIHTSLAQLHWTSKNTDLRFIFIAGNEAFTQGPYDYKKACEEAAAKNVMINTIFCGDYEKGVATKWKDGAKCANGQYLNIDQDEKVVHIDAPQDDEIERLNNALNDTYMGYGSYGRSRKMMQVEQDNNAASYGKGNNALRAASKVSSKYKNSSWDIIDAIDEDEIDIEKIAKEDLPEEMQSMTIDERKKYIATQKEKRISLQKQITDLNEERRKYVTAERKKSATDNTLDEAIITTIRQQATAKGYTFDK